MRVIYICDRCGTYIDEIEVATLDDSILGFDVLTESEKEELVHVEWNKQVATVKVLCDECLEVIHVDIQPTIQHIIQ